MKTKTWTKPKLIVLFKGRPEEAVLQVCKGTSTSGNAHPSAYYCGNYTTRCSTINNNPS